MKFVLVLAMAIAAVVATPQQSRTVGDNTGLTPEQTSALLEACSIVDEGTGGGIIKDDSDDGKAPAPATPEEAAACTDACNMVCSMNGHLPGKGAKGRCSGHIYNC